MIRSLTVLLALAGLAGCHHAVDTTPAPEQNAAALEANLETQANAMDAEATASADRNAAAALADNAAAPSNTAAAQP